MSSPATPARRRRWWRDWPWAAKLSILLGALAVVPLAFVTVLNGAASRSELIAATREQNLQRARSTAGVIDDHLEGVLADLKFVALAPGTVRFLAGDPDPRLREEVLASLGQMRETHDFDALFLADPSGRVLLASDPRLQGRNVIANRYFLEAAAGNALVHEPRYAPDEGEVYFHASAPVRRPDGPIVGVAVGRVPMSLLDDIIRGDTEFAGRGEFGILWDVRGIRLSHPSKPGLRFRPFEPLPEDTAARLIAESRFGPETSRFLEVESPLPGVTERSRWLLYDGTLDPHLRLEAAVGPVYAELVPLRGQRWVYGIFSPESAILTAVRAQTRRTLMVAVLTAIIAVTTGWLAARWVARPLALVGQTANAIAAGDLSRRVGLRQDDEVGQMAATFDAMADSLAAKDAELRGYADRLEHRVAEQTAELREAVEREQEARRRAEEANRLKDEFLSTVSHELRTPLNAILGWTFLMSGDRLDEAGLRRAVQTIERNARAQSQIIDDLLDVSRIVTGKLRLKLRRFALQPVIETAIEAVRPAAEAKGIPIEAVFEPVEDVRGDADRLQQVVWNLLSNSVKFTPQGGRIEVRLDQQDGQARIRVTDTGLGIEPEFLRYVFDRFRQADSSTTRSHGGLGLGLSIVRQLVELHGGTVEAKSDGQGLGATFTVLLPLAPKMAVAAALPIDASDAPPDLRNLRVLLVDDEPDAREVISAALEQFGAEVSTAPSASEALRALRSSAAHVLVADIGMPGEDGYSLIQRIREMDGDLGALPAIALTAYAGDVDRQRALDAGFQIHLAKPVEPGVLAQAVAVLGKVEERSGRGKRI